MTKLPPLLPPHHTQALVVFSDDAPLWWLRLLKRGFRHCFIVLTSGNDWLMVEPLSNGTFVQSLGVPAHYDVKGWFESHGLIVVATTIRNDDRLAPLRFYSCVEEVKRILRLRAPWAFTPYQLYRHLCVQRKEGDRNLFCESTVRT